MPALCEGCQFPEKRDCLGTIGFLAIMTDCVTLPLQHNLPLLPAELLLQQPVAVFTALTTIFLTIAPVARKLRIALGIVLLESELGAGFPVLVASCLVGPCSEDVAIQAEVVKSVRSFCCTFHVSPEFLLISSGSEQPGKGFLHAGVVAGMLKEQCAHGGLGFCRVLDAVPVEVKGQG